MDKIELLPIDVGFDLKATKYTVLLDRYEGTKPVSYEDKDGTPKEFIGSFQEVYDVLVAAGYLVQETKYFRREEC